MSDSPVEILERWEQCGGTWRVRSRSSEVVELELCTCDGEPVDALRSTDPAFLEHLGERMRERPR
jgi:uncharacterized protein